MNKGLCLDSSVDGDLQVWAVDTLGCPPVLFDSLLTSYEINRHQAATARGRPGYGPGRIAFKLLAGRASNLEPEQVVLRRRCAACGRGGHGKPHIDGVFADSIDLSVTTSRHLTLLALNRLGAVGIDLEYVSRGHTPASTSSLFSTRERIYLAQLPRDMLAEQILTLWVRKEAVVKCLGIGLATPLRRIEVSGPRPTWRLPAVSLSVTDLKIRPNTVAALAYRGTERPITIQRWDWRWWLAGSDDVPGMLPRVPAKTS